MSREQVFYCEVAEVSPPLRCCPEPAVYLWTREVEHPQPFEWIDARVCAKHTAEWRQRRVQFPDEDPVPIRIESL